MEVVLFNWHFSDREGLTELRSGSVLQPSTSSHVSFYINKSFFSPSLPLLLFLSCTPTQSLSEAHEDGRRKEGGGWSMTREKGKVLLLTPHLQPFIYCFFVSCLFPDNVCFQESLLSIVLELLCVEPLLFVLKITPFVVKIFSPLAKRCWLISVNLCVNEGSANWIRVKKRQIIEN